MRFFNNAGPVNCADHYCLDPLHRIDLDGIESLIAQQRYFILHAPRQTGKTSSLLALMAHLNRQGRYRCLCWAMHSDRPLVLLIDEIDALIGDTLVAVLRQLRAGYDKRPATFPQTVVLCGVRDVRDYRIHSARSQEIITGGSAFNIKAESIRLGNFTAADVAILYRQHTADTGQSFTPEAIALIWDLTRGQPWLVNALGYQLCFRDPTSSRPGTSAPTAVWSYQSSSPPSRSSSASTPSTGSSASTTRRPLPNCCSRLSCSASSMAGGVSSGNMGWDG